METNGTSLRVLLVEDDDGDALLVQEMLSDAEEQFEFSRARTIREAMTLLGGQQCVLVDLGLPDAVGLEAVRAILDQEPRAAVIVLTGVTESARGLSAVAAGAQDYLVKGHVDGALLGRAIRYAVERRRAEEGALQLVESRQNEAENARMTRGLLPRLLIRDAKIVHATRYRPSGYHAVVGGDFFDAVELADGSVRAVIGDVCGHGPEEAALGVAMRVGWRALAISGTPESEILPTLDALLCRERASDEIFATMCTLALSPDRRSAEIRLAGHPAPLLFDPEPRYVDEVAPGLPLGVDGSRPWPRIMLDLGKVWMLLSYTDGLIEGASGSEGRLGIEGLVRVAARQSKDAQGLEDFLDRLIFDVESRNGGPLADDIALLALSPAATIWGG